MSSSSSSSSPQIKSDEFEMIEHINTIAEKEHNHEFPSVFAAIAAKLRAEAETKDDSDDGDDEFLTTAAPSKVLAPAKILDSPMQIAHPFMINNNGGSISASLSALIRTPQHNKYKFMKELVTMSANSGLVKPFGGVNRDSELHNHQVKHHAKLQNMRIDGEPHDGDDAELHDDYLNFDKLGSEAFVTPNDLDLLACKADGTIAKGKAEGAFSAQAFHALTVTEFGKRHVGKMSMRSNHYAPCWVWRFSIKTHGQDQIIIEVVSLKTNSELKVDGGRKTPVNADSICHTWDMSVNCLVLGMNGYELHPLLLADLLRGRNVIDPLLIEAEKDSIKKEISEKTLSVNPASLKTRYVQDRVDSMLRRGWTAKISVSTYSRHVRFLCYDSKTRKIYAFSEKAWNASSVLGCGKICQYPMAPDCTGWSVTEIVKALPDSEW